MIFLLDSLKQILVHSSRFKSSVLRFYRQGLFIDREELLKFIFKKENEVDTFNPHDTLPTSLPSPIQK